MSDVFVTLFVRMHKTNSVKRKDGKYPLVLQVTRNRKVRRKRLGLFASIEQWDFNNHEFKKGVHGRREKNKELEQIEEKARKVYNKHFEGKPFDYKKFTSLLQEKPVENIKVIDFCLEVSQDFLRKGKANSCNDYKVLSNAIKKISPNDLFFYEFTQEWLDEFEEYHVRRGVRCFDYMARLRALFGKAVQKKIADFRNNPFKNPYTNPYGYDISKLRKLKIAKVNLGRIKDLSKKQLLLLKTYEARTAKEQEYMDVWWFSFYMFGVNLTDLAQLKRSHIKNGRWFYERSKTGVGLKRGKPIIPEAQAIIDRQDKSNEYIFPILTNGYDSDPLRIVNRIQNYAGHIRKTAKKICDRVGIDGYFTYYSTRYSSATLALNEGADRNTVSHLLDHENFSTIDNYAGRADDTKILEAMQILRLQGEEV